jgi:hypothetical protein
MVSWSRVGSQPAPSIEFDDGKAVPSRRTSPGIANVGWGFSKLEEDAKTLKTGCLAPLVALR